MDQFTLAHKINIIIHVFAGSTALIVGILILIAKKGRKLHRRLGRIFLVLVAIVIGTGLLGVFAFGRNSFLVVLTLLSAYYAYSGYRISKTKKNVVQLIDVFVALVSVSSGIYFIYFLKSIGMMWSPVTIYATVGALFLIVTYDFLRYLIPAKRYKNIWLYEHIYKMIGAFTALFAAFVGTVFPNYKPYSQVLPSVFGSLLAIGFMVWQYRKGRTKIGNN